MPEMPDANLRGPKIARATRRVGPDEHRVCGEDKTRTIGDVEYPILSAGGPQAQGQHRNRSEMKVM
jgi:hypothetical protein